MNKGHLAELLQAAAPPAPQAARAPAGDCAFVPGTLGDFVAYTRSADGQCLLVAVNFGMEGRTLDLATVGSGGELLLSTHPFDPGRVDLAALPVRADESLLVSVA